MKSYMEIEMRFHTAYMALNKIYFNKELSLIPIILMSSRKHIEIDIHHEIAIVNITSDIEQYEMLGCLLFEMCQLMAFNSGHGEREDIAIELANILNNCGFTIDDEGTININNRFEKYSEEYKEIQKEMLFLLNDLNDFVSD